MQFTSVFYALVLTASTAASAALFGPCASDFPTSCPSGLGCYTEESNSCQCICSLPSGTDRDTVWRLEPSKIISL
ncbi:hypothetical protein BOTNAR_0897g00040 [Botryotinia narcissicola]|uniref:Extracellular membrane protein CFEM domain-containing protein n=1 Tax=Botryotinia narcissicola TaxID=278944 RepID=A0A4Z1HGM0_9HELO|nr:hypothetical protein BOTNAR_0897g00040 [Botryotinia narcissicola]